MIWFDLFCVIYFILNQVQYQIDLILSKVVQELLVLA